MRKRIKTKELMPGREVKQSLWSGSRRITARMRAQEYPIDIIPFLSIGASEKPRFRGVMGGGLRRRARVCYTKACQILPLLLNDSSIN